MDESPQWQQMARLRPSLRSHVVTTRHVYRGQPWYILTDRASGRHLRYPQQAHFLLADMDGSRSVADILARQESLAGVDEGMGRDEIQKLVAELHGAGMLQSELPVDARLQFERHSASKRAMRWQKLLRPMMLRIPLLDPDPWLSASSALARPFFSGWFVWLWLLVTGMGAFLAWTQWPALLEHAAARAMDPVNLALIWLCYPLVKGLHELGHAYAVKIWGGEVHEMGIMLLVFIPVPYVDASAATAFSSKRRRMVVGAAGIGVELLLAALALLVWVNVQPGLLRDMAFNVALIGSVSTLVFNGNPLLRFDGYYVLMDALEIPNLGSRSTRYLYYLAQRYLFGLSRVSSPVRASGEQTWFVVYGLASGAYRLLIGLSIALYVAGRFFVIGVLLAGLVLLMQMVLPLLKLAVYLIRSPALHGVRARAIISIAAMVVLAWAALAALPMPNSTHAEGVAWLPEQALVRVAETGFVTRILQPLGAQVAAGTPLLEMQAPWLRSRLREQAGLVAEIKARREAERIHDPGRAQALAQQLAAEQDEYEALRKRVDSLILHSAMAGRFNLKAGRDLPGRYLSRGDVAAYVTPEQGATVRVAVPQSATERIRGRTRRVEIVQPGRLRQVLEGRIQREVPLVGHRLPNRRLGTLGGGDIPVDSRDESGLLAMQPVYQFDIGLSNSPLPGYFQDRVYIRFIHPAEPLAVRWYRSLRQLLLARLSI